MKLYAVQLAPNPTRVRLYIAEKLAGGASFAIEEVTVKLMKGEQKQPEHLARTPFGSVPVLEIEPGDFIIESLAIMEYLEDRYPDPSMRGSDPRDVARHREVERIIEQRILTAIARYIHATDSPIGLPASADIAKQAREFAQSGLSYVDALLGDKRPFVMGDHVSMADCTLAAALQFARFGQFADLENYANVLLWDTRFRERESATAILTH